MKTEFFCNGCLCHKTLDKLAPNRKGKKPICIGCGEKADTRAKNEKAKQIHYKRVAKNYTNESFKAPE